tara:strand:- start:1589 stop:1969 length:381 start_codon:yes stop_codon:yes gene_type:complete
MPQTLEQIATELEVTIDQLPEELSSKVLQWTHTLCESLEKNYQLRYPDSNTSVTFTMKSGKKYIKVIQDHNSVHAFVDKNTGEVYKPASWKSPAKHVRYDMRIINQREKLHDPRFTDWAGGYLYLR